MTFEEKLNLIKRNTEEILTEEDLLNLLKLEIPLKHYIGFEISGKLHIGSGLMSAMKVADFTQAGISCVFFLADWHTWINDKLNGDLQTIKKVAVRYFKEALKACLFCVGGDPDKISFVLGSDLYHESNHYWETVIDVSKNLTLARVVKSSTIMGRKEGENQIFARLIYPSMQVADIFTQQINLAHAGMDQRKAHVIAREVAEGLKICPLKKKDDHSYKPVAIHHHLILGLQKPPSWPISDKSKLRELWSEMKMSKSNPKSAIFIDDSPEEINEKIMGAFCPENEIGFNPILDWSRHLIFPLSGNLLINRKEKFGGDILFNSYEDLERTYGQGKLHPLDLKTSVSNWLVDRLAPAREHFAKPEMKAMKEEMEKLTKTLS